MSPSLPHIIGLASDHAGFALKEYLKPLLHQMGYTTQDYGCPSQERCDYPDYAHLLAHALEEGQVDLGIAICGSGNGISMALNKHPQIRAALCWTPELAALARQHNNANVLSLPARFISEGEANQIVSSFLESTFEGGRHTDRVRKISLP